MIIMALFPRSEPFVLTFVLFSLAKVTKGILGFQVDPACQEKKVLLGSQV